MFNSFKLLPASIAIALKNPVGHEIVAQDIGFTVLQKILVSPIRLSGHFF